MAYVLGVDLGTTYTAAAIYKDGRLSIASLGNQSATIPSVLLLKDDESILTGEAANRRGMTEPERVARDFKRRVGDTTPIFLGGSPHSAEALMARLLRWVADEVATREGGPPAQLAVCHPANWGHYKQDLLAQAVRIADLGTATFVTEPEAAAMSYASEQQIEPGKVIAVYDLGGGTFDAAIMRKTADSFEILGRPEGIERLGGIDFDAAVFAHVVRSLDGQLAELDEDDQAAMSAVARLRQECVAAKEALTTDSDVSISVMLPNVQTEVRLTRSEFETMIRPSLADSIGAMRRAFASADLTPEDVDAVLMVGGSSRIPLVAQMVGAELGRPVALDTHPKHAVALGAAYAAAMAGPNPLIVPAAAAAAAAPLAAAAAAPDKAPEPPASPDPVTVEPATAPPAPELAPTPEPAPTVAAGTRANTASEPPPGMPSAGDGAAEGRRIPLVLVLALVLVLVIGGGIAYVIMSGDKDGTPAPSAATDGTAPTAADVTTAVDGAHDAALSSVTVDVAGSTVALAGLVYDEKTKSAIVAAATAVAGVSDVTDTMTLQTKGEQCTELIRSQDTWACFQNVTWDGSTVKARYTSSASTGGSAFDLGGFHLHVFGSNIAPNTAGEPGPTTDGTGKWKVWDDADTFTGTLSDIGSPDGVPDELCVRGANSGHQIESLDSGNCWPITDESGA